MTWIQQETSKGLCPMCRQSKTSPLLLLYATDANPAYRVRVEGKRRGVTASGLKGKAFKVHGLDTLLICSYCFMYHNRQPVVLLQAFLWTST